MNTTHRQRNFFRSSMTYCLLVVGGIALPTPLWAEAPATGYSIIANPEALPILTPSLEERQTLKVRLNNGLEAYLISDPGTDKSGAALAVNVGHWSNPANAQGLAHFLEHMLFLGTSKYPEESEYHRFVTENGGITNAYTSSDHTAYMFAINHAAFPEALDRFSWFFKEPLFNPSGVDRELKAIDQEYAKNLDSDHVREIHVQMTLANSDHPFHNFGMGNLSTLKNMSQETLKKFYYDHYSANLMHLVVYSSSPLEELKALVLANFDAIENRGHQREDIDIPIYDSRLDGHMVHVTPIKNVRTLSLMWELPSRFARQLQKRPDDLISFVLGHEGEESLLAQLKREGVADGLAAGGYELGRHNHFFGIEIQLTEKGLARYTDVIERCYQTIAMLREKGLPSYLFSEIQKMGALTYQYQSREDTFTAVTAHARNMLYEELKTLPEHTLILQEYDPQLAQEYLSHLTPAHGHYTLLVPQEMTAIQTDKKEPWLGTSYAVKTIDADVIDQWTNVNAHPAITLPAANRLIPQNLALLSLEPEEKEKPRITTPTMIVNDPDYGKMLFAQDDRYFVPEINWRLTLKSPELRRGDARARVLADLFVRSVQEELNAFSYNALLAGLQFTVAADDDSIDLSISGYSENAPLLFEKVMATLLSTDPSEEKFLQYREAIQRQYENFAKESPLVQAAETLRTVVYKEFVTEKKKAEAIKKLRLSDLMDFSGRLFARCYLEATVYGNMAADDALALWQNYRNVTDAMPYPVTEHQKKEVVSLPRTRGPYFVQRTTPQTGNAIILAIQNGDYSFRTRAAQQILGRTLEEPFFSTLRTKQQTGYIVYNAAQEIELQLLTLFAVQSSSHNVRDLLARFELFIEERLQEIDKGSTEKQFQTVRDALVTELELPPKNMGEMTVTLHLIAFEYGADFNWIDRRIDGFKSLSFAEYITLAKQFLGRDNWQRLAIFVKGKIAKDVAFDYKRMNDINQLRRMSRYVSREEVLSSVLGEERQQQHLEQAKERTNSRPSSYSAAEPTPDDAAA